MSEIKLKVKEAYRDYVGKNIATLNINIKQSLQVISGDIIQIKGTKVTASQVWPEKNKPGEENVIRMDQYTRKNAGVSIGEFVTVQKIEPQVAQEIELVPLKEINLLSENHDLIIKKNFLGRPFVENNTVMINIFGTGYFFIVKATKPQQVPVILSESTKLTIYKKPTKSLKPKNIIGYEDIGGLNKEIETIREMVELPFKYANFFEKLNVSPPKGILLFGAPGTGKTLLAKALSNELKANFISIDAPQVMAKYVGEAEERLREIFKKAQNKTPAIIFIDEIDAIAPKRDGFVSEVEKRVVAQLLASMDGMSNRGDVVVIGATNRRDDVDPALRRPGRFDREIDFGVPGENERYDVLKIHTRNVPLKKGISMRNLAKRTHGFVGADLAALVKEAAIYAIKNSISDLKSKSEIPKILEKLKITKSDFDYALKVVQPSALREVFVDTPDVDYSNVGALKEQKDAIKDIITLSLKKKDILAKMNVSPPKKILLYGPPGTGKTMFVKASAKEHDINFIYVKGPEILDKWLGESEKTIRNVFKKAKDVSPCILFFDEIDSLTQEKNNSENQTKVLDQLLTELDNIDNKDIIFIASTNRPDLVDKSFLRSGRIDKILEFRIPNKKERKEILTLLLKKTPTSKIDLNDIAEKTEGFSGADLNLLVNESIMRALKDNDYKETKVTYEYLQKSLDKVKKKTNPEAQKFYDSFKKDPTISKYVQ